MRGKWFKTEQIIKILKESDLGISAAEICRKHGIFEQTFYNWKNKYGGMDVNDEIWDRPGVENRAFRELPYPL